MEGLKPEDLGRYESVGEAQVSPDGTQIVYTLSGQDGKADKGTTSLWLCPLPPNSGEPWRLTQGGKERSPRWSPDGKHIGFVSDRSGKPQVWVIRVGGGEAWRIPTERAVGGFSWSPDGKSISFTSRDFTKSDDWLPYEGAPAGDRERAVAQAKEALGGPKPSKPEAPGENGPPKTSDVKVITRFNFKADGMGFRGDLRSHIYVVDVEGAETKTEDAIPAKRITDGDFDHDGASWSPDGKYVVFTANRDEKADWALKGDIWLKEISSDRIGRVYASTGPVHGPAFSPDGKTLAFGGHDGHRGPTTQGGLWVLDVRGYLEDFGTRTDGSLPDPLTPQDARCLTRTLDRPIGPGSVSDVHYGMGASFHWQDESTLLFVLGDRGAGSLWKADLSPQSEPTKVWGEKGRNLVSFHSASGKYVFQIGSSDAVEELYAYDEDAPSPTKLTDSNPWLAEKKIGHGERITFKGADGWDIDGFLTYPVDYDEKKRYPLALFIHGGPAGAYGPSFTHMAQIMAAEGFAVLGVNPRGSSTYSQEFLGAVVEDWGGKDYQDIMAGVDEVIARGIADPERLVVTGWSYGGFMTSWVVTQTPRFKAAVGGAIISDRYSMHSSEDIVLFGEHYFGGTPWDEPDKLLSRSPLLYVKNVVTPFMVLHGEQDLRCPTGQGDEFYTALRRLEKTAVYIRYPGEYHGLRRLTHRIDRLERTLAWFQHYAGDRKES